MADLQPLQGELQAQVMAALWRLDEGTVDDVRGALPPRHRSAYTTVQTVLNRLADRGLLERCKQGRTFLYRPKVTEAEYVSQLIRGTLAVASADARQTALVNLVGTLEESELAELQRLAEVLATRRQLEPFDHPRRRG